MLIPHWLRNLSRRLVRSLRRNSTPRRSRWHLAPQADILLLEQRILLSGSASSVFLPLDLATLSGGTITPTPTGLIPNQIRQAYRFNTISFQNGVPADGTGQTIAIVEAYNQVGPTTDIRPDVQAFDQQFGLPVFNAANQPTLTFIAGVPGNPTFTVGTQPAANANLWGFESRMDVEWAHALAPKANIVVVQAITDSIPDLVQAVDAARNLAGVSVVSMSFGWNEANDEPTFDQYFTTPAGHIGVTFVAATGDTGTPATYPSSSPNVLAVGGTTFSSPLDANGDYVSETVWNTGAKASGGGVSQFEPQPGYQKVSSPGRANRATPDVSFDAGGPNSGVWVYDSDSLGFGPSTPWGLGGGTSLAAPCWAGLIAIADQGSSLLGNGTLSGIGTISSLYSIANGSAASQAIHDVTSGDNKITSGNNQHPGNSAGAGYDLVTGLGTPNATFIAEGLSGNIATPTEIAPSGTITTTTPTFQWSPVAGAAGYQLIVKDLTTGGSVLNVNLAGTTYTPPKPLITPGDSYTWTVQAYPVLAGISAKNSSPNQFSLPLIGKASQISPANGAQIATTTPNLQWTSVNGATYYTVTLTDVSNSNAAVITSPHIAQPANPQSTNPSWAISSPLTNGDEYSWTVTAYKTINGSDVAGTPSLPHIFYVQTAGALTLQAPGQNAIVTTETPTFQWTKVAGSNGYFVSIFDLTTDTSIIKDFWVFSENTTTFTTGVPLPNGHKYQWSVQSVSSSFSSTTPTSQFTVRLPSGGGSTLAAPVPIGPSENPSPNVDGSIHLEWTPVSGAIGYGVYLLDISYGSARAPIATVNPYCDVYSNSGSREVWWVVAHDSNGNVSAPSSRKTFSLAIPETGHTVAPTLLQPVGGTMSTYNPVFKWSIPYSSSDGNYYSGFFLFDDTIGEPFINGILINSSPVSVASCIPTSSSQLVNGHTYTWSVAEIDTSIVPHPINGSTIYGGVDGLLSSGTFTLECSTPVPSPISPIAGTAVNSTTPMFKWSPITDAVGYILSYCDIGDEFGSRTAGQIFINANQSPSSAPSTLLANGHTYRWVVNAVMSGNVPGPSSNPQYFTVSTPGTPTLVGPVVNQSTATPAFNWTSAADAAGYLLYVKDATTNTFVVNGLSVATTSYTPGAVLTNGDSYQWYVQAFDDAGDLGVATAPAAFSVKLDPPAPVTVKSFDGPLDATNPTFQSSAVTGAAGYYLTVIDTSTTPNTTVVQSLPVATNSYTIPTPLIAGHTYQWSVQAYDQFGNIIAQGAPGEPLPVPNPKPPSVPNPTAPGTTVPRNPGATPPPGPTAPPLFNWPAGVPGVTGFSLNFYDVARNLNIGFDVPGGATSAFTIPISSIINAGGQPATGDNQRLINGTEYQWSLSAYNDSGNSPYSAPLDFVLNVPPPTVTANNPLVDTAPQSPFDITYAALLAASGASDPDNYAIQFIVNSVQASGTLTVTDGAGTHTVQPGSTVITAGDKLTFTPAAGASGTVPAFTVTASNGLSSSTTPVQAYVSLPLSPVDTALFTGEYAVSAGNSSPSLPSIGVNGSQLTLTGSSTSTAFVVVSPAQLLANGAIAATYQNNSISFGSTSAFAGQTWTKLDLPANYTNLGGDATQVIANGTSLTFSVPSLGVSSPGSWINPTQVSAFGQIGTVGSGKITWSGGNVWTENLVINGSIRPAGASANSTGTATISASLNSFVTNYTNLNGFAAHVFQTGTSLTFVVDPSGTFTGATSPGSWISPTQVAAFGQTGMVDATGSITWSGHQVWSVPLAPASPATTNYTNLGGAGTHIAQNGVLLTFVVNATGESSPGYWMNPTQVFAFGQTGTVSGSKITWSGGNVWSGTSTIVAPPNFTNYTNLGGAVTQVVQNGTSLTFSVPSLGVSSPGYWISPTQVYAPAFGQTGTVSGSKITWSGGNVWSGMTNLRPSTAVLIALTDTNGAVSYVQLTGATTLVAVDGALAGMAATRQNNQLFWTNGDVWNNFDFNALNALFEMATGYP